MVWVDCESFFDDLDRLLQLPFIVEHHCYKHVAKWIFRIDTYASLCILHRFLIIEALDVSDASGTICFISSLKIDCLRVELDSILEGFSVKGFVTFIEVVVVVHLSMILATQYLRTYTYIMF